MPRHRRGRRGEEPHRGGQGQVRIAVYSAPMTGYRCMLNRQPIHRDSKTLKQSTYTHSYYAEGTITNCHPCHRPCHRRRHPYGHCASHQNRHPSPSQVQQSDPGHASCATVCGTANHRCNGSKVPNSTWSWAFWRWTALCCQMHWYLSSSSPPSFGPRWQVRRC